MFSSEASANEALGAKIKRLRQERKLAQDRLAIEANVDQSGLSKFERGQQTRFGPTSLSRIAKVLGLSLEELIEGTDWKPTERIADPPQ